MPVPTDTPVPTPTPPPISRPTLTVECDISVVVNQTTGFNYNYHVVNNDSGGRPATHWSLFPPEGGSFPNESYYSSPEPFWDMEKLPLNGPPYFEYRFNSSHGMFNSGESADFVIGTNKAPVSGGMAAMRLVGSVYCGVADIEVTGP
jgi:hypothetical protein